MAKGKHAVALFEVIHSAKKPQGQTPQGLFRTPKWWFKGRSRAADRRTPAAPATHALDAAPSAPPAPAGASHQPSPRERVAPSAAAGRSIEMDLDRDHKQITFRVSFHSAIVTSFAVLMVVVVAYAIGRKMSGGPASATAGISSEQVRSGPARPDVLNLGGGTSAAATDRREIAPPANSATVTRPAPTPVEQPAPAVRGERIIGMQYVIIQSFLDEAAAERTAAFFREHGMDCTVEAGLPGWGAQWRSVVGTQGFPRASGIDYERYFNKILTLSDKYAASKKLPPFKPLAISWKARKS